MVAGAFARTAVGTGPVPDSDHDAPASCAAPDKRTYWQLMGIVRLIRSAVGLPIDNIDCYYWAVLVHSGWNTRIGCWPCPVWNWMWVVAWEWVGGTGWRARSIRHWLGFVGIRRGLVVRPLVLGRCRRRRRIVMIRVSGMRRMGGWMMGMRRHVDCCCTNCCSLMMMWGFPDCLRITLTVCFHRNSQTHSAILCVSFDADDDKRHYYRWCLMSLLLLLYKLLVVLLQQVSAINLIHIVSIN